MKKVPLPVLIVAIALLLAGIVGFIYHLKDFADPAEKIYVVVLVELLRILAIVSAVLLLRANNLGRWLSIGWVLLPRKRPRLVVPAGKPVEIHFLLPRIARSISAT